MRNISHFFLKGIHFSVCEESIKCKDYRCKLHHCNWKTARSASGCKNLKLKKIHRIFNRPGKCHGTSRDIQMPGKRSLCRTRLYSERYRIRFLEQARCFSCIQNSQTSPGAHRAFNAVGTGAKAARTRS
jgi:hypothetical protein